MATQQQYAQQPARRAPVNQPPPPVPDIDTLFVRATEVKTRLRVMLWGKQGSSKTPTALSFPRPAVIDVDALARVYARSFPTARFMDATTLEAVKMGIRSVTKDNGANFDTLIIDSLTPIYDEQKNIQLDRWGYLDQPQWSRIKSAMKEVYRLLAECPLNTVIIGREAIQYEEIPNRDPGKRAELKAVGTRIDLDSSAGYQPNIIIHMTGNNSGIVDKVQGVNMPTGTVIPDCTWKAFFEPIAKSLGSGDDPQDITTGIGKLFFLSYWNGRGVKNSQIAEALGVKSADLWKKGRSAADERVYDYAVEKRWIETEDNTPASPAQPPAARVSPLGVPVSQTHYSDKAEPANDFENALNDGLVPMSYRDFARMINTYQGLVENGTIPPDWDTNQIIDYMINYALENSE